MFSVIRKLTYSNTTKERVGFYCPNDFSRAQAVTSAVACQLCAARHVLEGINSTAVIDTLTRCSSLSCLIPHTRAPSQRQSVFLWLAASREVNNTFVRRRPGPHKRDRSGFIIGLLDIRLSSIDLLGLPREPRRFLSNPSPFFPPFFIIIISARPADSSLFIHKSGTATDSKFVSLRFWL